MYTLVTMAPLAFTLLVMIPGVSVSVVRQNAPNGRATHARIQQYNSMEQYIGHQGAAKFKSHASVMLRLRGGMDEDSFEWAEAKEEEDEQDDLSIPAKERQKLNELAREVMADPHKREMLRNISVDAFRAFAFLLLQLFRHPCACPMHMLKDKVHDCYRSLYVQSL